MVKIKIPPFDPVPPKLLRNWYGSFPCKSSSSSSSSSCNFNSNSNCNSIPIMHLSLLSLFLLSFTIPIHSSPTTPSAFKFHPHHHFTKSIPSQNDSVSEYFQVNHPLPFDHLTPACSLSLLNHSFASTYGLPPVTAPYSPPANCTTWSHAVLLFHASSHGDQYDRIAGVWLEGVELLRTSTPEPTENGIFWNVRKDVTRYSSLLRSSNLTLSVMLENIVNDEFTGIYVVNVSVLYYDMHAVKFPSSSGGVLDLVKKPHRKFGYAKLGLESDNLKYKSLMNVYETPADLIIPISGNVSEEIWFRIKNESDVYTRGIQVPANTMKAVLEVYVSFHGDDEFWYSNPPDSYVHANNLTTGRAHGAYREVLVTIDGNLVGSVIPIPVIFTGGINPLFWAPVVAIGAFDLPSYDFDLTPFLGLLLDGKSHLFGLIVADSISFWLVDANLHLWLDPGSEAVQAQVVEYNIPTMKIERKSKIQQLDGSFKTEAKRKSSVIGWVNSTAGNLTAQFSQEVKFENVVKFQLNGTVKSVEQKVKIETEVNLLSGTVGKISKTKSKRKYPLSLTVKNLPKSENETYVMVTAIAHGLKYKYSEGGISVSLDTTQNATGWMLVKDHDVLDGAAETHQTYDYKDALGCYSRIVSASNGRLVGDNTSFPCVAFF